MNSSVVVVDDEPLVRERVCTLVTETPGLALVGQAANGLEALSVITEAEPDIVFIDIEMPELNGFGVIAALDERIVPAVVFVTAFEHYAVRAFDVGAVDYLHKPINRPRFQAAVERARARVERRNSADTKALVANAVSAERARGYRTRFVVRRGNAYSFVPVGHVMWIDVGDNYLQLHVDGRTHLSRGTMKQVEEELDPTKFLRVHRSAMVAIDHVRSVRSNDTGGYVMEMRDGATVRASRPYAERIRALVNG